MLTPPATAKGHLNQEKNTLHSTKVLRKSSILHLTHWDATIKTHEDTCALITLTHKSFSDLTGRFPQCSSRGNEYVLVLYDYDSYAVLAEPVKHRQAAEIIRAWEKLNDILKSKGQQPKISILNNACSSDLQQAFHK